MLLPRPGDIYTDSSNNYTVRVVRSDEQLVSYERNDRLGQFSMATSKFEAEFSFLRSS